MYYKGKGRLQIFEDHNFSPPSSLVKNERNFSVKGEKELTTPKLGLNEEKGAFRLFTQDFFCLLPASVLHKQTHRQQDSFPCQNFLSAAMWAGHIFLFLVQ